MLLCCVMDSGTRPVQLWLAPLPVWMLVWLPAQGDIAPPGGRASSSGGHTSSELANQGDLMQAIGLPCLCPEVPDVRAAISIVGFCIGDSWFSWPPLFLCLSSFPVGHLELAKPSHSLGTPKPSLFLSLGHCNLVLAGLQKPFSL